MDDEQAKAIAETLDQNLDLFFAANRADKVKILKHYLDRQIGTEATAKMKSVPGMPMLTGPVLELVSDALLDVFATFVVNKFFAGGAA